MNCPPSANMFMMRAPFPRAIGTDFSGVLESNRQHRRASSSPCYIALNHQRFVEASGGGQGELTI